LIGNNRAKDRKGAGFFGEDHKRYPLARITKNQAKGVGVSNSQKQRGSTALDQCIKKTGNYMTE